jgi:hypothetical protein
MFKRTLLLFALGYRLVTVNHAGANNVELIAVQPGCTADI